MECTGKAKINLEKDGISFEKAQTAFDDENVVDALDDAHLENEIRYNLIGLTTKGLLFVDLRLTRRHGYSFNFGTKS